MRAIEIAPGRRVVLSDTVGFISDLPTQLVAAFRATLEEVIDADLILHVRDIAHPESAIQAKDVRDILTELGIGEADEERIVEVWNKIDALPEGEGEAMRQAAARLPRAAAISALTGEGVEDLLALIAAELAEPVQEATVRLGFDEGRKRAWLFEQHLVQGETRTEEGYRLDVRWSERDRGRFESIE
jgi:GTP-binding protein HflX